MGWSMSVPERGPAPRPPTPEPAASLDERALDLLDALAAIKGRAQVTRRRVLRVEHLDRHHIAEDLRQIDDQVGRMTELVRSLGAAAGPAGENGRDPTGSGST